MARLSDVFKYISHFRHAGHQVGRKVGDMLEVLTYAALSRSPEMESRLWVEPKLYGFSKSGHKVEFVLHSDPKVDCEDQPQIRNGGDIKTPEQVLAFIECKKVGVEQTINTGFKSRNKRTVPNSKGRKLLFGEKLEIGFSRIRSGDKKYTLVFTPDNEMIASLNGEPDGTYEYDAFHRFIFALDEEGNSKLIPNESSLRDYQAGLERCRILEVLGVDEEGVVLLLNDCLPGPQTPEKAKQSSFVALDVRKHRFGSFDKRANESEMQSVLIMTEFAHWEQKSVNMVKACIDSNLYVPDNIIIEAFELFEEAFGPDFYDKITKDSFLNDKAIRKVAAQLVEQYQGKIFVDIEDNEYKQLDFLNDRLIITS